jgi:hypothetical protein
MIFTIRRSPSTLWAALFSLAAILASPNCFALNIDEPNEQLPMLGQPLPGSSDPITITQGLSVTGYDSRPGAPYTIYLDFGGFAFNGNWGGNASYTPGTTPAYTVDGDASTFTQTELDNIRIMWSRVAEKYSGFNINVTTVDPAIAAGQAANDTQRQNYYDNTSKLMHTVIGGLGSWYLNGTAGGTSYVGVTAFNQAGTNGKHTDFVFAAQAPNALRAISEATGHENGHGLNLNHQSVQNPFSEYNDGGGATGPGSKAPIMGKSYNTERGLWRIGYTSAGGNQNDLAVMMSSNPGLGPFIDDGVGHSTATATPLPLVGQIVDYNLAKGVIVPATMNPTVTTGASNYQSDFWSFSSTGGHLFLSVVSGRESINPGSPDPGPMLDASLEILNSVGAVMYTSATANNLSESLFVNLPAGDYFAHVMSAADPTGSNYYDIGSYFLNGSFAVPEPSTIALLAITATGLSTRRRKMRKATTNPQRFHKLKNSK